jgi:hypothetical protein
MALGFVGDSIGFGTVIFYYSLPSLLTVPPRQMPTYTCPDQKYQVQLKTVVGETMNMRIRVGALALSLCLTFAGCSHTNDAVSQAEKQDVLNGVPVPSIEQTKQIARAGFVYGLPLVMAYAVMYQFNVDKTSSQYKGPFNAISNEARVFTYKDTAVITPNSDTPYSFLQMDLRAEPMVISVPAVERARYYSVQLTDGNTFNFGYIGTRATGTEPSDYMVVGPDWKGDAPAKIKKVFHSTTQFAVAIFRTQLFNPGDMPNVVRVQKGYKGQTLSAYLKQPAPAAAPAIDFLKASDELVKQNFFEYLNFALQFAPAGPEEVAIRTKLLSIGVGPGKKFEMKDLSPAHKAAVLLGIKAGSDEVDKFIASGSKDINGWQVGSFFGDRAYYNGDWLRRAGAARGGIYGNTAIEAAYPLTRKTASGDVIDTSKHNYTITFGVGQLPPVNAFWSVTMYDGKSQLLIENPINRYLINSPMLPSLKKNADGPLP